MEFFKQNTKIRFMEMRKASAIFSILIFVLSIAALVMNGLNLGLEFTGGTQVLVHFEQPANLQQIREDLRAADFHDMVVQSYGTAKDVQITVPNEKGANKQDDKLINKIMSAVPKGEKLQTNFIGAQVGKELATKGALAIFVSLLLTMAYIAMRFEWRFALSSTIALIHDPILILGIFSYFQLEFNLYALAAILTVLGYSLNDTIVIFDRVRENFRRLRKMTPVEIVDISVNQTLSRTIMTSSLTLIVIVALLLYGGEVVRGFSIAMTIGILIGTYSSIYVAGALAVSMGLSKNDLMPVVKDEADDRP